MSLDKIKSHTLDTILLSEGLRFEGLIKSKKSDKQIINNLKGLGYSLARKFYERCEASEAADNLAAKFEDLGRRFRRERIEHYILQSYDNCIEHIDKFKTPNIITIYKEICNDYIKPLRSKNFGELQKEVDFSDENALNESILGQTIREQIKLCPLEDLQKDAVREAMFSTIYRVFVNSANREIKENSNIYYSLVGSRGSYDKIDMVVDTVWSIYNLALGKGVKEKHLPDISQIKSLRQSE